MRAFSDKERTWILRNKDYSQAVMQGYKGDYIDWLESELLSSWSVGSIILNILIVLILALIICGCVWLGGRV